MKPIQLRIILLCLGVGAGAAFIANSVLVATGYGEITMSPLVIIMCLLMGAGTLWMAFQVARWRNMETRAQAKNMSPVAAARVLACAQGVILTGASLTGWLLGLLVYQLLLVPARGFTGLLWITGANLIGAGAMLGMGIWAQYLCRIPPDDSDTEGGGSASRPMPDTGSYARGEHRS